MQVIEAIIIPLLPLSISGMFPGLTMNGRIRRVIGVQGHPHVHGV